MDAGGQIDIRGVTLSKHDVPLRSSEGADRAANQPALGTGLPIGSVHPFARVSGLKASPAVWCFVILWVGLLFIGRERMFRDPGTFWHTVIGERMLESGRLMTSDPFSFTFENQPWIAQQWLGECAMALVHREAGLDGLLLGAVTLLAATFAWLYGRFRRAGLAMPPAVLLLMMVLAASSYHFHPRPHLATIALTALTLGVLADIETGRRSRRWLLALPPLMVIWTNLHGGALAGIITTILVLAAWMIPARWRRGERTMHSMHLSPFLGIALAALCGLSALVNPFGLELLNVWLGLSTSKVLPTVISEHGPVALGSMEGMALVSLAAIYLFILAGCVRFEIRATWLVPLLWLPLAFLRVRHGPLFAVTSAVAIAGMLLVCRWPQWLSERRRAILSDGVPARLKPAALGVCGMMVAAAFLFQSAGWRVPLFGVGWARLDGAYWPVEATHAAKNYLKAHPSDGRVINDMLFGGYLIYALPQAQVYIDDRCELYGDEFLLRYVDLVKNPAKIEEEAATRGINLALVKSDSRMAAYLSASENWTMLHRDGTAALFLRTPPTPPSAAP